MKKLKFSASPLQGLGNLDFSQFLKSQIDRIRDLGETELTDQQLKTLVAMLLGSTTTFDTVMLRMHKNAYTEELTALDQIRSNSIRAFMKALRGHDLSLDPAIIKEITYIDALLKPHDNLHSLSLDEETSIINNIIGHLEKPNYLAPVALLGLRSCIAQVKKDNQTIWLKYNECITADMERDITDSRELRGQICEEYDLLCDYVYVNARLGTKPEFAIVFTIIETLRKQYLLQAGRNAERKPVI
ncbi:DUF6261 family protein [Williamwhitmania taraxaci]|uniref:Uncharacterized protein n=1 Tax=Williamwhitmania taraxaci TaxID=1640674 RepID=A0A1G6QMN3_9BACT|nr:DUF6261 family protein [Williamwhitmania taraxaci]SDC93491.1 hypothetical protein SAMN05216323_106313 [Williamwhitmania taraxaci]